MLSSTYPFSPVLAKGKDLERVGDFVGASRKSGPQVWFVPFVYNSSRDALVASFSGSVTSLRTCRVAPT